MPAKNESINSPKLDKTDNNSECSTSTTYSDHYSVSLSDSELDLEPKARKKSFVGQINRNAILSQRSERSDSLFTNQKKVINCDSMNSVRFSMDNPDKKMIFGHPNDISIIVPSNEIEGNREYHKDNIDIGVTKENSFKEDVRESMPKKNVIQISTVNMGNSNKTGTSYMNVESDEERLEKKRLYERELEKEIKKKIYNEIVNRITSRKIIPVKAKATTIAQQSIEDSQKPSKLNSSVKKYTIGLFAFEKIMVILMSFLMALVTIWAMVGFCYMFAMTFSKDTDTILKFDNFYDLFSAFFNSLIGLELVQSIIAMLDQSESHVENIILVSITAVCRKIIILDYTHVEFQRLFGIAGIVITLGILYYLVKAGLAKTIVTDLPNPLHSHHHEHNSGKKKEEINKHKFFNEHKIKNNHIGKEVTNVEITIPTTDTPNTVADSNIMMANENIHTNWIDLQNNNKQQITTSYDHGSINKTKKVLEKVSPNENKTAENGAEININSDGTVNVNADVLKSIFTCLNRLSVDLTQLQNQSIMNENNVSNISDAKKSVLVHEHPYTDEKNDITIATVKNNN